MAVYHRHKYQWQLIFAAIARTLTSWVALACPFVPLGLSTDPAGELNPVPKRFFSSMMTVASSQWYLDTEDHRAAVAIAVLIAFGDVFETIELSIMHDESAENLGWILCQETLLDLYDRDFSGLSAGELLMMLRCLKDPDISTVIWSSVVPWSSLFTGTCGAKAMRECGECLRTENDF